MHFEREIYLDPYEVPTRDPRVPHFGSKSERACLIRHLVVACESIASEPGPRPDSAYFLAIAARLRDMDVSADGPGPSTAFGGGVGQVRSLIDLLAEAWEAQKGRLPLRGLDPELVEAAEEILRGLAWRVPIGGGRSLPVDSSSRAFFENGFLRRDGA